MLPFAEGNAAKFKEGFLQGTGALHLFYAVLDFSVMLETACMKAFPGGLKYEAF